MTSFNNEATSWPADEEASRDLVILVYGPVQESLLAVRGSCVPTRCITAVADLARTSTSQWKNEITSQMHSNSSCVDDDQIPNS